MRILILANYDLGLYKFRKELIEELLNRGHQVYISLPDGDLVRPFEIMGCVIFRIGKPLPLYRIELYFTSLSFDTAKNQAGKRQNDKVSRPPRRHIRCSQSEIVFRPKAAKGIVFRPRSPPLMTESPHRSGSAGLDESRCRSVSYQEFPGHRKC